MQDEQRRSRPRRIRPRATPPLETPDYVPQLPGGLLEYYEPAPSPPATVWERVKKILFVDNLPRSLILGAAAVVLYLVINVFVYSAPVIDRATGEPRIMPNGRPDMVPGDPFVWNWKVAAISFVSLLIAWAVLLSSEWNERPVRKASDHHPPPPRGRVL